MEEGLKFAFPVNFAFDDATVRPEDVPALDRFAKVVQRTTTRLEDHGRGLRGSAGTTAYNRSLSMRRAESVRAHLTSAGLSPELIDAIGYGETRQVVVGAERDDPGAEKNRRVVFVVESRGEPDGRGNTLVTFSGSGIIARGAARLPVFLGSGVGSQGWDGKARQLRCRAHRMRAARAKRGGLSIPDP